MSNTIFAPNLAARLGGDEFAVLLPKFTQKEDIHAIVQKILLTLEKPIMVEDLPIIVEPSIGVVFYPDHGANADTLLQRADVAMYAAKETGNGYAIYEEGLNRFPPQTSPAGCTNPPGS